MKGKQIKALLLLLVALLLTSCGSSKPDTKNGARPVVIGLGKGDGDSIPYVDTDAPPATPTPTPTPTPSPTPTPTPVPTGEVSPSVTPEALGTFSAEDCMIIVAGVEIRTGMDYTGKENLPGEIIDKLEGVACLEAGNDINYYYSLQRRLYGRRSGYVEEDRNRQHGGRTAEHVRGTVFPYADRHDLPGRRKAPDILPCKRQGYRNGAVGFEFSLGIS